MLWLDDYERRARLIPGLWLIAPVVVAIFMFGLKTSPLISAAAGLLTAAGGPVVLANLVRHYGLRLEPALIAKWGGWPTTQLLRSGAPAVLAARRRAVATVTGAPLPDPSSEATDGYEAAIQSLRNKTRDRSRFNLVFEENRNYGYERNLLGVRAVGIWMSCIVVAVSAPTAALVADHRGAFSLEFGIGLVVQLAIIVFWLVVPSEQRARKVAFKYAERLLDAAETLA